VNVSCKTNETTLDEKGSSQKTDVGSWVPMENTDSIYPSYQTCQDDNARVIASYRASKEVVFGTIQ